MEGMQAQSTPACSQGTSPKVCSKPKQEAHLDVLVQHVQAVQLSRAARSHSCRVPPVVLRNHLGRPRCNSQRAKGDYCQKTKSAIGPASRSPQSSWPLPLRRAKQGGQRALAAAAEEQRQRQQAQLGMHCDGAAYDCHEYTEAYLCHQPPRAPPPACAACSCPSAPAPAQHSSSTETQSLHRSSGCVTCVTQQSTVQADPLEQCFATSCMPRMSNHSARSAPAGGSARA